MAITQLLHATSSTEVLEAIEERQPLYQKGCKITLGARNALPAPTLALALHLVRNRRASSRILQPIAATRLQRAWLNQLEARRVKAIVIETALAAEKAIAAQQSSAAIVLQTGWRRHEARAVYLTRLTARASRRTQAATRIQAAERGRVARGAYRRQLRQILGPLAVIQAAARGWLAVRRLKTARAAASRIASTWRRVRCVVLRRRLARAANALRKGGKLAKYRKRKGANHERHERFAWVSEDLQHLLWAPVADRFDEHAPKLRSIPMASITAVTAGVKTPLLKKMERRAADSSQKRLQLHRTRSIHEDCAFSVICRERVIDFYADDSKAQFAWLRDLKTVLANQHTYDPKAALAAVRKFAVEPPSKSDSDTDDD